MNQETNLTSNTTVVAPPPRRKNYMWRAVLSAAAVLVLSGCGILYGQQVVDAIKARLYHPTGQIESVTTRLQLTDRGRDIFYATNPLVESKQEFNNNCQSEERTVAILGCYYRDRVYLYAIANEKLDGTLEVTAAHEMLHAAYQRLNFFERARVDQLIKTQYAALKDDASLKEIMQYYQQAEPGAEINELHSILGTTVATLDPELEQYYNRYFGDRASIVALNATYNKVFGDIKKQTDELEARIKVTETSLKADLGVYEVDRRQVELDISNFNEQASTGAFATRSAFNAARSALVARVDALNTRRDEINQRVAAYNADVAAINKLAVQASDLYKSINGAETTTGV